MFEEGRGVKGLPALFFFPVKIKMPSVKIFDYFWLSIREIYFPSVKISEKMSVKTKICA